MDDEAKIRLGFFFGIFTLIALLEWLAPRRALTTSKAGRWFTNLGIIVLNPISVHLVFPVLPVGMALLAAERHRGLLKIPWFTQTKRMIREVQSIAIR